MAAYLDSAPPRAAQRRKRAPGATGGPGLCSTSRVPVLSAQGLCKRYGERIILDGVSLALEAGERAGLVGSNGSGKTSLARMLAGLDDADAGQVVKGRDVRLAYLAQEPVLEPGETALDVVLAGMAEWTAAVARHDELSAIIHAGTGDMNSLLAAQAAVAADVERLGGWDLQHEAEAVLGHLGIADPGRRMGSMSGGERRRVAMARLLVARPDVAILDEPTNHLDVDTIEWLESYLGERFRGALLLITHDRYLLDRVVTRTFEIEGGALYAYDGGWEDYLTARAERQAHAERVEANRQNFLRRELEWLRRQPKARTTKQKARIDRAQVALDRDPAPRGREARLRMDGVRSGHTVLAVENLTVELAGRRLLQGLNLHLGKRERIGIVGPNGCGKTTLLRVFLGEVAPAAGTVRIGSNTRIAYLDQNRSGLDDERTVFDTVDDNRMNVRLGDAEVSVHTYLERFLFSGPAQKQKVGTLSGGERARVALARLLVDATNLVILDEPTNDLDVTTLAALEEALLDFEGTVLVATHDRWFLDRVATSILAFETSPEGKTGEPRAIRVEGGYQSYLAYREARARERAAEGAAAAARPVMAGPSAATAAAAPAPKKTRALKYGERLELEGLMERVEAAESAVAALEAELASPGFYERDYKEQNAFMARLAAAKAEAEALVERWLDLESRKD
jgi:ATP-binding cassette subfamily F protein uup